MFGPQITIRDLKSKKIILKDRHAFRTRYLTTFRESGTGLMASVNRRVIFTAPAQHSVALALDYETHRQLTTPAGQMLDGSTGLNGPRVLDIAVLYLIKDGKICSIWMTPDRAGVIKDPKMPLEMIQKTDDYSSFASIVKEHLGTVEPRAMYTTRFSCGCHEIKGRRATMEDKSVVFDFQDPAGRTATFVSVYDGHGGHEAAQFLGEHLHSNFQESSGWKGGNALLALEEAFATTDRQLLEAEEPSGSCAVVAVLVDSCLYVAHVGDCRAVLCRLCHLSDLTCFSSCCGFFLSRTLIVLTVKECFFDKAPALCSVETNGKRSASQRITSQTGKMNVTGSLQPEEMLSRQDAGV